MLFRSSEHCVLVESGRWAICSHFEIEQFGVAGGLRARITDVTACVQSLRYLHCLVCTASTCQDNCQGRRRFCESTKNRSIQRVRGPMPSCREATFSSSTVLGGTGRGFFFSFSLTLRCTRSLDTNLSKQVEYLTTRAVFCSLTMR